MPAIKKIYTFVQYIAIILLAGCYSCKNLPEPIMKEHQLSFSAKNHALDNNDNFSPDDKFLCYDTRGTVYNENLANSKSIEKIEISTGRETVLWEPEYITGEEAAPGVAAVSWHPSEDKVIFIHGPLLHEIEERGYYNIRNRTGVEVSADGKGTINKVDYRDIATNRPTVPGAQRGGTHRHEYSRNGKRIGFTYDDFLIAEYDRTIGYMEPHPSAPISYSHYFAILLKPAKIGKSAPGEIEKAYGDSWADKDGTMRAFIGKVRAENGVDYYHDLYVTGIPESTNITTAISGDAEKYPEPPSGIIIRRLTHGYNLQGIVRGSYDGKKIAFLTKDDNEISQIFITDSYPTYHKENTKPEPIQLTHFDTDAAFLRWHPSGKWILAIVDGNIYVVPTATGSKPTVPLQLTNDNSRRTELVISNDGNTLAYNKKVWHEELQKQFSQIFTLKPDWDKLETLIK